MGEQHAAANRDLARFHRCAISARADRACEFNYIAAAAAKMLVLIKLLLVHRVHLITRNFGHPLILRSRQTKNTVVRRIPMLQRIAK